MAVMLSRVEPCKSLGTEMDFSMAPTAKGDQIFFHIASQKASRLNVMDLEIFRTSTSLASEGRSMAQICEAFLRAGSESYKKEATKILQRFLAQRRKKEAAS
jgi:hypothetical protein